MKCSSFHSKTVSLKWSEDYLDTSIFILPLYSGSGRQQSEQRRLDFSVHTHFWRDSEAFSGHRETYTLQRVRGLSFGLLTVGHAWSTQGGVQEAFGACLKLGIHCVILGTIWTRQINHQLNCVTESQCCGHGLRPPTSSQNSTFKLSTIHLISLTRQQLDIIIFSLDSS